MLLVKFNGGIRLRLAALVVLGHAVNTLQQVRDTNFRIEWLLDLQ